MDERWQPNRVTLATMSFEGKKEPSGIFRPFSFLSTKNTQTAVSQVPPSKRHADTFKTLVHCMKVALGQSISSISMKEKERLLSAQDFDYRSTLRIKATGRGREASNGPQNRPWNCCSVSDARWETEGVGRATAARDAPADPHTPAPSDDDDDDDDDEEDDATDVEYPAFTFTEYAPMCYRHLREFLGISADAYHHTLTQRPWKHTPSEGKSAAQLFYCQHWVIKTMTASECRFLRAILHRYYHHLRDHREQTLLPKFVGQYRINLNGERLYFVIMNNVMRTTQKIVAKYDLKGSTEGRFATLAEKRRATATLKDLDINRTIRLGPELRGQFLTQLAADASFLSSSNMMDYSLLIGVSLVRSDLAMPSSGLMESHVGSEWVEMPPSVGERDSGHLSVDGREMYFFGIIDILQEYNAWKMLETAAKAVLLDRQRISSVPPQEYARRFYHFIEAIVE